MWASRHKNIRRRFAVTQLSKNRLEKRNQVARSKLLFLPIELLDLSRTKPKKLTAPRACGQADIKISDGIFCRNFCRCSLSYLSIAVQSPYFDRANGVRTSRKIADSCFAVGLRGARAGSIPSAVLAARRRAKAPERAAQNLVLTPFARSYQNRVEWRRFAPQRLREGRPNRTCVRDRPRDVLVGAKVRRYTRFYSAT